MDAACEVFAAKGFYGARVSDIAKKAGVADGTIYLYFKSKDEVLIKLFESQMEGILERFHAILDEIDDPIEQLRSFIELHLAMVAERPTLAEVITVELRQSAKFVREYRAPGFIEYLDLLEAVVVRGQEAGVFESSIDPTIFKRALFGALDEVSLYWISSHRKAFTLKAAATQIWQICAQGILRSTTE